jgi:transposase
MHPILGTVRFSVKDKLCKQLRRCRNAGVRVRYLIILNLCHDRSARQTAAVLGLHNTTVYRVAGRFRQHGEWALWDAREDNGETKLESNDRKLWMKG